MLIAFLLAVAFHASDSIQQAERVPFPQMENVCIDPPPVPPVFKSLFTIGGLAAGMALFLPIGTAVAEPMRGGCDGYSCMGSGMFGAMAGMVVVATLPVLGYKTGSKLDLKLVRKPNRMSLQLSIPIDAITSRRKATVGSMYESRTLAYASGKD